MSDSSTTNSLLTSLSQNMNGWNSLMRNTLSSARKHSQAYQDKSQEYLQNSSDTNYLNSVIDVSAPSVIMPIVAEVIQAVDNEVSNIKLVVPRSAQDLKTLQSKCKELYNIKLALVDLLMSRIPASEKAKPNRLDQINKLKSDTLDSISKLSTSWSGQNPSGTVSAKDWGKSLSEIDKAISSAKDSLNKVKYAINEPKDEFWKSASLYTLGLFNPSIQSINFTPFSSEAMNILNGGRGMANVSTWSFDIQVNNRLTPATRGFANLFGDNWLFLKNLTSGLMLDYNYKVYNDYGNKLGYDEKLLLQYTALFPGNAWIPGPLAITGKIGQDQQVRDILDPTTQLYTGAGSSVYNPSIWTTFWSVDALMNLHMFGLSTMFLKAGYNGMFDGKKVTFQGGAKRDFTDTSFFFEAVSPKMKLFDKGVNLGMDGMFTSGNEHVDIYSLNPMQGNVSATNTQDDPYKDFSYYSINLKAKMEYAPNPADALFWKDISKLGSSRNVALLSLDYQLQFDKKTAYVGSYANTLELGILELFKIGDQYTINPVQVFDPDDQGSIYGTQNKLYLKTTWNDAEWFYNKMFKGDTTVRFIPDGEIGWQHNDDGAGHKIDMLTFALSLKLGETGRQITPEQSKTLHDNLGPDQYEALMEMTKVVGNDKAFYTIADMNEINGTAAYSDLLGRRLAGQPYFMEEDFGKEHIFPTIDDLRNYTYKLCDEINNLQINGVNITPNDMGSDAVIKVLESSELFTKVMAKYSSDTKMQDKLNKLKKDNDPSGITDAYQKNIVTRKLNTAILKTIIHIKGHADDEVRVKNVIDPITQVYDLCDQLDQIIHNNNTFSTNFLIKNDERNVDRLNALLADPAFATELLKLIGEDKDYDKSYKLLNDKEHNLSKQGLAGLDKIQQIKDAVDELNKMDPRWRTLPQSYIYDPKHFGIGRKVVGLNRLLIKTITENAPKIPNDEPAALNLKIFDMNKAKSRIRTRPTEVKVSANVYAQAENIRSAYGVTLAVLASKDTQLLAARKALIIEVINEYNAVRAGDTALPDIKDADSSISLNKLKNAYIAAAPDIKKDLDTVGRLYQLIGDIDKMSAPIEKQISDKNDEVEAKIKVMTDTFKGILKGNFYAKGGAQTVAAQINKMALERMADAEVYKKQLDSNTSDISVALLNADKILGKQASSEQKLKIDDSKRKKLDSCAKSQDLSIDDKKAVVTYINSKIMVDVVDTATTKCKYSNLYDAISNASTKDELDKAVKAMRAFLDDTNKKIDTIVIGKPADTYASLLTISIAPVMDQLNGKIKELQDAIEKNKTNPALVDSLNKGEKKLEDQKGDINGRINDIRTGKSTYASFKDSDLDALSLTVKTLCNDVGNIMLDLKKAEAKANIKTILGAEEEGGLLRGLSDAGMGIQLVSMSLESSTYKRDFTTYLNNMQSATNSIHVEMNRSISTNNFNPGNVADIETAMAKINKANEDLTLRIYKLNQVSDTIGKFLAKYSTAQQKQRVTMRAKLDEFINNINSADTRVKVDAVMQEVNKWLQG